MRARLRWGCLLFATTCFSAPALAQSAPPVNHNVDSNGVDLVLGTFELSQRLLSIGPDWPHGLHYVRIRDRDRWLDNFTGGIHQVFNQIFVSVGGTSAKFIFSGGNNLFNSGSFASALGDGSTLTRSAGVFTFTNGAGEIARFTAEINGQGRIVLGTGRMMDLRYPNGVLVTLNYRTETLCDENQQNCMPYFRIQSVTNNFSYQLHYGYAQNSLASPADAPAWRQVASVRAINTAVEACDPYADKCSLTGAWPAVGFTEADGYEIVTLPDGNSWRFAAGAGGLTAVRRPGSASDDVSITYYGSSGVESVTGLAGTWTYSYSSNGGALQTTMVQGPLGGARIVTSDIERQIVLADRDALGRTTSYQYDGSDRVTRVTAPEGNYVQFTYDARGNVTEWRTVAKPGSGLADIVETASYPAGCANPVTCNQPTSVTDARGNVTDFAYSATHGGVLTATAPAPAGGAVRPQTRIGYTAAGVGGQTVYLPSSISACQIQSSCTGTADEALTTISYAGANFLPTTVSSGNGSGDGTLTATSTASHDEIGNRITIDGPLPGTADTTRLRYNALRQIIGLIGPDPDPGSGPGQASGPLRHRAMRIIYDNAGLETALETGTVDSQSDGDWAAMNVLDRLETGRDALGRPVAERLTALGATYALTQTGYDAAGRIDCVAQRMNPAEFASPPGSACTLDTEGAYGPDRIARTTYDAAGQVILVRTGVGTGDEADEVAATYTGNGRVETVTDAEGNRTTYVYDGLDRLSRTRMPSPMLDGTSSASDYEERGYDANGNVTARRLRDGNGIAYTYDNLNRLISKDLPGSEPTVTYGYDLMGRLIEASQGSHGLGFTFDALGRNLTQSGPQGTASYAYDLAGRRTRLTYPGSGLFIDYDYNIAGDLIAIRENGATSGAGLLGTYAYDDRGRRILLTRGNGTATSYAYDNTDRLIQLAQDLGGTTNDLTLGFGYNPASQIVQNTRSNDAYSYIRSNLVLTETHNGLNEIATFGALSFTYDLRGNLATAGSNSFGYSSENMLTSVTGGTTLAYDPLLRLYENAGGGATYRFAYDGLSLIAEYNGDNILQRRFVHGPEVDEPLVWYEGTGTSDRRWFHADERGSIIAVSDGSGNPTTINRYDEYGNPASTNAGRFQYTGQTRLSGAGLYHYRARAYWPALGRFMQADPIGYGGGANLYAYVRNDPVNLIDPMGLQGECPPGTDVCGERLDRGGPGGLGVINSGVVMSGPTVASTGEVIEEQNVVVTGTRLPKPIPTQRFGPRPRVPFFARPPMIPRPSVPFPRDPRLPPGQGWEWRGNGPPGSNRGNWYNPQTGESLHPDQAHPPPVGPHYDYRAPDGTWWRWYGPGDLRLQIYI